MLAKIKWLWSFYRHHPYVLFVLVVLTPVNTLFLATIPRAIGFTVDYLETGLLPENYIARQIISFGSDYDIGPVISIGLAYIVFGFFGTALYAFVQSHRAWMNLRLEWMARQMLTEKNPW